MEDRAGHAGTGAIPMEACFPVINIHTSATSGQPSSDPGRGAKGGHAPPPSVPDNDYLLCTS